MKFFHVVTIVASVIASFVLFGAIVEDTAPKQAAAAIALGIAVIPYVLMRAIDASRSEEIAERRQIAQLVAGNGGMVGRLCQLQDQKQAEPTDRPAVAR